jgi:hypothetical protein
MREGEVFNCDGSNLDPILKFDASGKLDYDQPVGPVFFCGA